MNLTKFARTNQRNLIVVALAAASFIPAIIIGAVNAPRVNPTVMAKPFKLQEDRQEPASKLLRSQPLIEDGASFPAPPPMVEDTPITIPTVVIWGDQKAPRQTVKVNEPEPSFIHQSVNGGMIRVTGFEPGK